MAPRAEVAEMRESKKPDIIVLPDTREGRPRVHDRLAGEFGESLSDDVIERVVAAAQHALERSGRRATPDEVERVARDRLRHRVAASKRHARAAQE